MRKATVLGQLQVRLESGTQGVVKVHGEVRDLSDSRRYIKPRIPYVDADAPVYIINARRLRTLLRVIPSDVQHNRCMMEHVNPLARSIHTHTKLTIIMKKFQDHLNFRSIFYSSLFLHPL